MLANQLWRRLGRSPAARGRQSTRGRGRGGERDGGPGSPSPLRAALAALLSECTRRWRAGRRRRRRGAAVRMNAALEAVVKASVPEVSEENAETAEYLHGSLTTVLRWRRSWQ